LIKSVCRIAQCSLLLTVAISNIIAQPVLDANARKPHVIIITIDGFPARALKDPQLPMPTLHSLISSGAVSSGMLPINPTVTWPNHTTIITGVNASQHFVMANGLIVLPPDGAAPRIEPWVDKDKLVHARTLYDAAAEKGMTTGQVDWVAVYGAKNVRWEFAEKPDVNGDIPKEFIAQGLVTHDQIEHFSRNSSSAWRDQVWTDAAVDIIEKHSPDLMLFHLLATDSIQHQYAPLTPAAYSAYAYADRCIARIVEAARNAGTLDQTTFFILSDHGFATSTHTISPNVALINQGLIQKKGESYTGSVWVKAEGGVAELFIRDANRRAELVPKLKAYFAAIPGIEHVYTNQEQLALGLPSEADTDQAPQLYLAAAPGYSFSDDTTGELTRTNPPSGAHGYLNTMSDMEALFVASGAAIKPGIVLGPIPNLRVAPTVAKILGLQLPDAKQPPLLEILR
jgi:predicted AlkP superfamily pyrophosphatase or phosphodiesterase